jgi:hypothetical protein
VNGDPAPPGYDDLHGHGKASALESLRFLTEAPWTLSHFFAIGGTAVAETGYEATFFDNTMGGPLNGLYLARRYSVRKTVTYLTEYVESIPWGSVDDFVIGYSRVLPVYGDSWCDVRGSVTPNSCELETIIYHVRQLDGSTEVGWFPTQAANVRYKFAVLGKPQSAVDAAVDFHDEPSSLELEIVPNPFSEGASIRFSSVEDVLGIHVYDVRGRRVMSKTGGFDRRRGVVEWNGSNVHGAPLPSGVYFIELKSENERIRKKVVRLR